MGRQERQRILALSLNRIAIVLLFSRREGWHLTRVERSMNGSALSRSWSGGYHFAAWFVLSSPCFQLQESFNGKDDCQRHANDL